MRQNFEPRFNRLNSVLSGKCSATLRDIIWVVYRLMRSLVKENTFGVVIAVVLIIVGLPWLWAIDLICIALNDKVWWLD